MLKYSSETISAGAEISNSMLSCDKLSGVSSDSQEQLDYELFIEQNNKCVMGITG
jgi:hypothetical protein